MRLGRTRIRRVRGGGRGGWLGYFDSWKRGARAKLLRIVQRREAGLEESRSWVAVVGLDDLVDGISEQSDGG